MHQTYPDLTEANTDNICGRLVYYPIVVACNGWNCVTYPGCHHNHKVKVSGCGCGCHKAGLTGWEIALIVIAAIFGGLSLMVVVWYIYFGCLKRSSGTDSGNNGTSGRSTNRSSSSARNSNRDTSRRSYNSNSNSNNNSARGGGGGQASIQLGTIEPVPGVPVWMNQSGAMLDAMNQASFNNSNNNNNDNDNNGTNVNNNLQQQQSMAMRSSLLGARVPHRIQMIISNWDAVQLSSWVTSIGLDPTPWHNNNINGKDLLMLSEDNLRDLGLNDSDIDTLRRSLATIVT